MIRTLLLVSAAAIPLCAAQSAIRSDGVMLVEGRPFVPLGIYYNNRPRGATLVAADMRAIADAGLNCIETSQIQAWDQPDAGLNAVRSAGLRGFLEASWQSSETAAWASARANRSEIVGWNLADDAHRRFTVEQMSAMKATARAAVPNQILYQTAYDGAAMGPYLPFTDTTWGYRYPTYNKAEGADQSAVGAIIMRPLQNSGVPFMAIPQAYRWDDDANSTGNRFPTAKEYRCQAWQGLACGAKGLIAYAMTDTTNAPWLPTAAPDLWQEIIATAHDVSDLRWVIADGGRTSLAMSGDPYWFYGAVWSWHGARLIAVTNASDASRSISTTIANVPAGTLSTVGRASASAWSWNGTTLSGTLAPAETCLFRIGSLANAAPVVATSAPAIPANGSATLTLATDADGDALTVTVLSGPTHGHLTGSGATVTYQPDPGYIGSDAIQVAVHDGWNDATGTMSLAVQDTGTPDVTTPVIATQPANLSVTAGQTASFAIAASVSATLTYQWQSAPAGSLTFAGIVGATSSAYTIASTTTGQSGTQFRCVVTNSAGTATSNAATLTVNAVGVGSGAGLTGTYFASIDFTGTGLVRTDATVDFDWGNGSPTSGVGVDYFSVRWTGQVQVQFSETYTFTTQSDDGVRLWVNGQQLVDNWTNHAPIENSGTITLVAGQKYDLTMEYYENAGGAVARLSWASPSTTKQIIPMTQLFPSGATPGALPAGWTAQDVGSVAAGGSTTQSNGTWTLSGSGADIWHNADGLRFASQRVTGDVRVTARVSGLTNTNEWAKAGVMIRESLTTGSRHASTFATAANGLAYQRRPVTDGASTHTAGPGSPAPYWVRIERQGNVVISSASPDGTTWTEIRRETIAMSPTVYVGLAVTSHNNRVLCTATFTDVQIVGVAAVAN